jgi:hypothetical protein
LIEFFSFDPNPLNIAITVALLLLDHPSIAAKMKYLYFLLLGIFLPMCFTPFMIDLWVRLGTGNANYLFFQGLASWVCLCLLIGDYLTAYREWKKENETEIEIAINNRMENENKKKLE